ncbi:MAG TPA: endo-1,4-beta-xylanase [Solirubrobacteraceae bacterium]|nr:endo-1,4-beta-xylanase [Solirubrobacteraceae bacterium]
MRGCGRIRSIGVLATLAFLVAPLTSAARAQAPETALRDVPQGTAVRLSALQGDPRYRSTFLNQFDSLTPENELKMNALQPHRGEFDFRAADQLVQFALDHGKTVHGHALVWGLSLPLWLVDHGATDDIGLRLPPIQLPQLPSPLGAAVSSATTLLTGWRRDELLGVMDNHITTVMQHFAGKVGEWDVVNEPMAEDGSLSPSVWERFIGPDYIEQALRTAHAADPSAKLFINDYAIEEPSRKQDGLFRLVKDLLARGVPLDGIGLQMHTHILGYPDQATLENTMRRFAGLGLKVEVTEMDVGTSLLVPAGLDVLKQQAQAYGAAARACDAVSACTRFTTWGFTDALSWIGSAEAPLLFDADYRPKPAFAAVRSAFAPRGAAAAPPPASRQPASWRWLPGVGARCGWGSCSGLRAGRG